jgi:transposase
VATAVLASVRPVGPAETARKQMCRDLVAEIRGCDKSVQELTERISVVFAEYGTGLVEVTGIGPVIAAGLLGRTRGAARFPTASAFVNYAGAAPVEAASAERRALSAERKRHRLPVAGTGNSTPRCT